MPDSQGLFPEPPAPAGVKTSPALESRDTVFLFLFIFFSSSMVPGSEAGSCSSSSGPGCVCYPDSDLMFRLAVASSAPSVCDRCRGHTAGKRAKGGLWRREADLQRVCVCARASVSINPVLSPYTLPRIRAFVRTCIWLRFLPVGEQREVHERAGDVRTD